jgi:hypothetical protein
MKHTLTADMCFHVAPGNAASVSKELHYCRRNTLRFLFRETYILRNRSFCRKDPSYKEPANPDHCQRLPAAALGLRGAPACGGVLVVPIVPVVRAGGLQ